MPNIEAAPALLAVVAMLAYLLGSIPFGIVVARSFGLGDLRSIGSGNIGATNVLRTGNKTAAALTLLLDGAKGALAVVLGRALVGEDAAQLAGLAAFLGHLFPVWLGFKGGKGVATFLGVALAVAWPVGAAACLTWLGAAYASRMSSYAALVASGTTLVWAFLFGHVSAFVLFTLLAILIYVRHSANIARIKAGTEPKIGEGASERQ
ncbi:MAG: glycerol-3-phosphate 1-O-acyltransferase PlsY [Pseudomonadota bacterium]